MNIIVTYFIFQFKRASVVMSKYTANNTLRYYATNDSISVRTCLDINEVT